MPNPNEPLDIAKIETLYDGAPKPPIFNAENMSAAIWPTATVFVLGLIVAFLAVRAMREKPGDRRNKYEIRDDRRLVFWWSCALVPVFAALAFPTATMVVSGSVTEDAEVTTRSEQAADWIETRYGVSLDDDDAASLVLDDDTAPNDCPASDPCRRSIVGDNGSTINSLVIEGKAILVEAEDGLAELPIKEK